MRDARRTFLKSLAAVPLLPGAATKTAPNPPQPPSPTPSPSPSPNTPSAFARALGEAVKERHGAHLDGAELTEVTQGIHGALQAAERLRVVPLGNADEPVTAFAARPPKAPVAKAPAPPRHP